MLTVCMAHIIHVSEAFCHQVRPPLALWGASVLHAGQESKTAMNTAHLCLRNAKLKGLLNIIVSTNDLNIASASAGYK